MTFLWHVVTKEGIFIDPTKVETILKLPRLNMVTKVRNFLGLAGYYRRVIKDFSKILELLTQHTKNGKTFS